jgi:hypothetical protein
MFGGEAVHILVRDCDADTTRTRGDDGMAQGRRRHIYFSFRSVFFFL